MKFCMDHWDALRAAVTERGLDSLVARDGHQAAAQLAAQLNEQAHTKTNFYPLMAAHNAILGRVLSISGLEVMMPNEDGTDKCPLCFAQQQHLAVCKEPDCKFNVGENWIPSCVDAMREEAIRLGLIGAG